MRFGMILLALIMLLSLAGSLIPQKEEAMTYVRAYGAKTAGLLIRYGLDDLFHTPVFILLEVLLCGNLILCSLTRFPAARRAFRELKRRAAEAEPDHPLAPGEAERIRAALKRMRFRQESAVFSRNAHGVYGSFLVHLSILVILLFGSLVLSTPEIRDRTVFPGDSVALEDGTVLTCLSFHIEDETGKLDYASLLRAENADGSRTKEQEVRVNEPMRFGPYKIYQQTYGTAGRALVHNDLNGEEETFFLTEPAFLSIDSRNGVYYDTLYPAFIQEEDGSYTLITSTAVGYADPVYSVQTITDGGATQVLVFPDETIRIGDITFTFLSPTEYPGLRIKRVSPALYGGLYAGFGLMVLALWLCFFAVPVCVRVEENGYAVCSPKARDGLELSLREILQPETTREE